MKVTMAAFWETLDVSFYPDKLFLASKEPRGLTRLLYGHIPIGSSRKEETGEGSHLKFSTFRVES
jgi:hypothetical protein